MTGTVVDFPSSTFRRKNSRPAILPPNDAAAGRGTADRSWRDPAANRHVERLCADELSSEKARGRLHRLAPRTCGNLTPFDVPAM
jgi:hypothetical protein